MAHRKLAGESETSRGSRTGPGYVATTPCLVPPVRMLSYVRFTSDCATECNSRNAASGLSAVDVERVPWLWVPQGVDVRDPAGYPASWRGHSLQTPQLESEVTLPPSLPISPAPGFPRVRVSERFLNGRDSPHPHPGRPLPMDDDYDSSPDYGHFRADASPRLARASSPPHTREGPSSNTYSSFATPESTMSPPDIPPSSSSYYPSDNYPSGSSRSHTLQRSSDQLYPGSAPRHNPLPPPPEHHPLAQSLLQKANRPTASDARNQ